MRVQLEIQEGIDLCLEQRDKELCQLRSQSQADGAQLAALSLQLQELISSCQEIGLVALMFFFELFIFLCSPQFPSMFPLLTCFQSFFSLSANHPRHSRQRRNKISILLIQETV